MGRCRPRPGQSRGDGGCDRRQALRFSWSDLGSSGQGFSSLRCRPATRSTLMLTTIPFSASVEKSVSLGHFQNSNPLKQRGFPQHGVEDESNVESNFNAVFSLLAMYAPATL